MTLSRRQRVITYVCGALLLVVLLGPFVALIVASLSSQAELLALPMHLWPQHPTFSRYHRS